MFVKTQFSIKDLENFTGVKAHTIRIWEKRYNLLEPNRTDTNIRNYDLLNLKKLLNVTFLYNEGYKISKIADYNETEIVALIESKREEKKEDYAIQAFKTAMFDFDYYSFSKIYNELIAEKSFETVFFDIFIPLLTDLGNLWQTGSIDPAHERFISEIIKQKIILESHKILENRSPTEAPKFALYLPYEEIHEIGLLFANYKILSEGYNTIYLGINIPLDSLKHLLKHYTDLTFISYFTVKPDQESIYDYAHTFEKEIATSDNTKLWLMGHKTQDIDPKKLPKKAVVVKDLKTLSQKLASLKKS